MRTVVELSDTEVTVDGLVYRMVQKEPEPEKFAPFKGQIGYAYDNNREHRGLRRFIGMKNNKYMCTQLDDLNAPGVDWENFDPIPGLVQFQPWSELDPHYNGLLNVQYANGQIFNHGCYANVFLGSSWVPVGFQKVEK